MRIQFELLRCSIKNGSALCAVLGWPKLAAAVHYGGACHFQPVCILVGHGAL